ncbi:MAG: class I tRNA ligase family protein, partial [Oscillospiraceae bacterium]|nr:class I tRNA ligase family protein [Oscillospiraceae bacterium]
VVPTKEPYQKRTSHGMILGEGGVKMSKSLGNVVNPNDVVAQYGADTMRLYIMFIGDFEKVAAWSDNAVRGCKRFLDRVWNLSESDMADGVEYSEKNAAAIHKAIRKVASDIDEMKFNTAIAALMSLVNDFYDNGLNKADFKALLLMLSPFAPHICEEMWHNLGFEGFIVKQPWPEYDESKTISETVTIAVQVGGKFKGTVDMPLNSAEADVVAAACASEKIAKQVGGKQIVKTIYIKNKLVNLIVK